MGVMGPCDHMTILVLKITWKSLENQAPFVKTQANVRIAAKLSRLVMVGLRLLQRWCCVVLECVAWKQTHPCSEEAFRRAGGDCKGKGMEYERVLRYNWSANELSALVEVSLAIYILRFWIAWCLPLQSSKLASTPFPHLTILTSMAQMKDWVGSFLDRCGFYWILEVNSIVELLEQCLIIIQLVMGRWNSTNKATSIVLNY